MKKTKIIHRVIFGALVCAVALMSNAVPASAAGIIEYISPDAQIERGYNWTPDSVGAATPFGTDDLDVSEFQDGGEYETYNCSTVRLADGSKKGNVGVLYANVGTYKGQKVDLKVTVTDYTIDSSFAKSFLCLSKAISPIIGGVGVNPIKAKYEFFVSGTNTPISIDGYGTLYDLDNKQYYLFHEGVDKAYILQGNTFLSIVGDNKILAAGQILSDADERGWSTILYSGTSFELTFAWENISPWGSFGFTSYGIVKAEASVPIKEVDKQEVQVGEEFTYKVSHYVPVSKAVDYYKSYVFTDTLVAALSVTDASQLTIKDEDGSDVTDKFTVAVDGQKITATLKNVNDAAFYGKEYSYYIKTKIKDGYKLDEYLVDGKYVIPNTAKVTIDGKDIDTELVNVETPIIEVILPPNTGVATNINIVMLAILGVMASAAASVVWKRSVKLS